MSTVAPTREGIDLLMKLAVAGDVQGVRTLCEKVDIGCPGYWRTLVGCLNLRLFTLGAIVNNRLRMVQYFCGEREVPPLADAPDEYGKCVLGLCRRYSFLPPPVLPNLSQLGCSTHLSQLSSPPLNHQSSLPSSQLFPPLLPPSLALALRGGAFEQGTTSDMYDWTSLEVDVREGHTDICMYLLTVLGPKDDVKQSASHRDQKRGFVFLRSLGGAWCGFRRSQ